MTTETVNQGLTIGNSGDPMRMLGRLKRLKESLPRAEGERKASLQAEIKTIEAQIAALKAALG
jgi:hypothetical protein